MNRREFLKCSVAITAVPFSVGFSKPEPKRPASYGFELEYVDGNYSRLTLKYRNNGELRRNAVIVENTYDEKCGWSVDRADLKQAEFVLFDWMDKDQMRL